MAIDPQAAAGPSAAHVSLTEAGALARRWRSAVGTPGSGFTLPDATDVPATRATAVRRRAAAPVASFAPHTAVRSSGNADPDRWDETLTRLGRKYNVPPLFLKAVMLAESGGQPDAVGDSGHSVGLFQLHDQGYGAGMGDARYDPETNADRAARGLAEAWHAGERAGFSNEHAVRAAYNYSFNPGGGWAYQGDSVVRHYNQLLANQGLPPLG
ncbi:MAG: transglycosylase SLT domain-containing protein [Gemmataceae bacterium]|nr:transglycosylase SLT domain-containing protein [Gemmataceae bacterium]